MRSQSAGSAPQGTRSLESVGCCVNTWARLLASAPGPLPASLDRDLRAMFQCIASDPGCAALLAAMATQPAPNAGTRSAQPPPIRSFHNP